VGYNVQIAVDAQHHLIVAHEVITEGVDRDQLAPMAEQAREATGIKDLTVVADRGYFKGEQILDCQQAGMATLVPKPLTSNRFRASSLERLEVCNLASQSPPSNQRFRPDIDGPLCFPRYWPQLKAPSINSLLSSRSCSPSKSGRQKNA
jgi:hypothetical protein